MPTIEFTPNDPSYASQQWSLPKIGAEKAWDVGMGSSTIVVAVTDNCIEIGHPDLAPILWVNPGEIAGNGVDDDGNGYIDDINGWDAANNDNDPSPPASSVSAKEHGTHVSGTAAAATNNGIGIASIGNGVSLMAVKGMQDNGSFSRTAVHFSRS